MRAMLILFVLANAGCLRKTEFQCSDDNACGATGRCETTGYCSFIDNDCSSGRRYDNSAGTYAGQCTGGGTIGDGGTVDSPPNATDGGTTDTPSTAGCPAGYAALTGAQAGHLYKLLVIAENWATQEAACQATSASSHLAVPDDLAELTALDALAASNYWLGITDAAVEGTWRNVLGATQTFLPWQPPAPDNAGGGQGEDCVEGLPTTHTINDRRCQDKLPTVCECVPP
jgi:hypothetical protein